MKIGLAVAISTALMLGGCEGIDALTFKEDPHSGVKGSSRTALYIVGPKTQIGSGSYLYPDLGEHAKQLCETPYAVGSRTNPLAAALVGLAVDFAINAASEALQAKVDAIKDASVKTYSSTIILDDASLFEIGPGQPARCLLITRFYPDPEDPTGRPPSKLGMALLLGINARGTAASPAGRTAVILTPLFLRVDNAAAITRSGKPIDISVAVSVTSVTNRKGGPVRQDISLGAFDIRDVKLGETVKWSPNKEGPRTALMALPPRDAVALEIKVAVVETGSALPATEKAKAQIKAVQAALGPEIKAQILKAFTTE